MNIRIGIQRFRRMRAFINLTHIHIQHGHDGELTSLVFLKFGETSVNLSIRTVCHYICVPK